MTKTTPLPWMAAVFCLAFTAMPAQAQKVYRCGADGREYSQTPCKMGREVDASDPRSAEQQRDGQDVARRQAQFANQLESERHAREAAARGLGPAGIKPAPLPASAASAAHRKGPKKQKKTDGRRAPTWKAAAPRP